MARGQKASRSRNKRRAMFWQTWIPTGKKYTVRHCSSKTSPGASSQENWGSVKISKRAVSHVCKTSKTSKSRAGKRKCLRGILPKLGKPSRSQWSALLRGYDQRRIWLRVFSVLRLEVSSAGRIGTMGESHPVNYSWYLTCTKDVRDDLWERSKWATNVCDVRVDISWWW